MTPREPTPASPLPDRYAPNAPLPPYRYVPGHNAHPIKHPDGHLHGIVEAPVTFPADDGWAAAPSHRRACDLFHHAYWWEAHEAWEALWHLAEKDTPEWRALRGLIQASAALLKRHLGHSPAVAVLGKKAVSHLRAAATAGRPVLSLDCAVLADDLKRALEDGSSPQLRLLD